MQLFYMPEVSGNEVFLDETESKHAIKVLRLGSGSRIQLTDGVGGLYTAEIVVPNPKKCKLEIIEFKPLYGNKIFEVHVAIAPTKNTDRMEWFVEKATEIGIDEISFILCENSERRILKPDRFEKIAISAMKQSVKAYLPKVNKLNSFEEFIRGSNSTQKFIAHCRGGIKPHLKNELTKGSSVLSLIGPEGDFSEEEISLAKLHGFTEITLSDSRLRTETAGIIACHIVNLVNE
jgi:16S rRNA (uracil1498-N3)-methyltransferase